MHQHNQHTEKLKPPPQFSVYSALVAQVAATSSPACVTLDCYSFVCLCTCLTVYLFLPARTFSHSDRWGGSEEEGPDSAEERWGGSAGSREGGAATTAYWRTEPSHRHFGGGAPQNIRRILLWLSPLQGLCLCAAYLISIFCPLDSGSMNSDHR